MQPFNTNLFLKLTRSASQHTVYGQVPVEIVDQLIEKHGGMVDIIEH